MIRPYKQEDSEKLIEIFICNTPKYFDTTEIQDFSDYLYQNGDTYLTVEKDNQIVGGAGYYVNESDQSGRITWIFFNPSFARQGLGSRVVNHCLKVLGADKRVKKFVVTTSQHAHTFFNAFGYQLVRVENDYWGKGLDLYEMEMPNHNAA